MYYCIYTAISLYMDTSYLVKEAKQGSAAAQKCIFNQWAVKMLIICRRYVKSVEDAEELMLDEVARLSRAVL